VADKMKDITKQKEEWNKIRINHPSIGDYIDFNIFANYNEKKNNELIDLVENVHEAVLLCQIFHTEKNKEGREINLESANNNIKEILKLLYHT